MFIMPIVLSKKVLRALYYNPEPPSLQIAIANARYPQNRYKPTVISHTEASQAS